MATTTRLYVSTAFRLFCLVRRLRRLTVVWRGRG